MEIATNDTIKCPCAMCRNYFSLKRDTIEMYLCKHGFREGYETWTEHGETHIGHDEGDSIANGEGFDEVDRMDQMLIDLAGDNPPIVDEQPTPFATTFYRMVDSARSWATGSSHVGSESTNDDNAIYGHDEDNLNAAYRAALETLNRTHA
ncbi:unnamed protein product [Miscanthus lutarioriparius]|uniref:Transposase-associated domain-containing protein n=1 Tax=Miscanthus lutarioriparius TaxID=422564 RepID=A0A811QB69_9POAL|nr:unnamed protein product [Miscanthus lutarioriparius]